MKSLKIEDLKVGDVIILYNPQYYISIDVVLEKYDIFQIISKYVSYHHTEKVYSSIDRAKVCLPEYVYYLKDLDNIEVDYIVNNRDIVDELYRRFCEKFKVEARKMKLEMLNRL